MHPHPRPVSDGARALRRYLCGADLSVPRFCDAHGLDRITVQRALNGERRRITVDLAYAIEKATSGAVPYHLWRQETRRVEASG